MSNGQEHWGFEKKATNIFSDINDIHHSPMSDTSEDDTDSSTKLRHLLTIKGTTHILTNSEMRQIRLMLAGLD